MDESGRPVAVEVKTICDQANDKITVHPDSRERKARWAEQTGARLFTVVVDRRDTFAGGAHRDKFAGFRYYVAEGVRSFRLGSSALQGFQSLSEVRAYIGAGRRSR